jgi:predicted TIM-barrel fold metal-dependent hydrolase
MGPFIQDTIVRVIGFLAGQRDFATSEGKQSATSVPLARSRADPGSSTFGYRSVQSIMALVNAIPRPGRSRAGRFPGLAAGAVGAVLAASVVNAQPPATATGASAGAIPFTDGHVHLNDPAAQLRLMQENDVGRAIIFWGRASSNATIVEAARAHPSRFIPFVSVSPERATYRELWARNDTTLLGELDRELRTGRYAGIGEISVVHFPGEGFPEADFDPAGVIMRGIMTLADRHRVPVLVHCEITRLDAFARLLRDFPTVTVIWAHGGYTPYFLAARMLEQHPNLIYELSARTWAEHPRSPDYTIFRNETQVWPRWLELIERHPERFIIGTDAAQRGNDREKVSRVRLLLSQLTDSTRALVATRNLDRIIRR